MVLSLFSRLVLVVFFSTLPRTLSHHRYKTTSPYSDKLPYMYDSLAHWEGCDGSTLLDSDDDANDMFSVIDTPPPTVTTAATAETSSLMFSVPSGIWGAMRF